MTKEHLPLLTRKLRGLYPDWRQFGRSLPVDETVIEGIKSNNRRDDKSNREKLQETLEKWKKKGGTRTWRIIYDALNNIQRKDVADSIRDAYPNLDMEGTCIVKLQWNPDASR